jgi:Tfp pilus assembly protein PilF
MQQIFKGLKMRGNKVASGFLFLGRIEKKLGNNENARKMFKKALDIEPNNAEAASELRLSTKRKEKKGFWKRK